MNYILPESLLSFGLGRGKGNGKKVFTASLTGVQFGERNSSEPPFPMQTN
ncbi:hypothetical protein [Spirosoma aerolatum]|nr:hypothetical protein [Spirosoma aerolatum]